MKTGDIQVGSTITNGNAAMRVTARGTGTEAGWIGIYISLGTGTQTGVPVLLRDRDLRNYWHVPFEWTTMPHSGVEERYVWRADHRALEHEVRAIQAGKVEA